jgi:oligopeptide/dipeptide ABC transporter ATP-binding protein
MADRVLVMYAGQVVEEADVATLFARPRHPYTRALLRSVPSLQGGAARRLDAIRGVVPEQYEQLPGCRFFGRCELAVPRCEVLPQDMQALSGGTRARCWRAWMDGTPLMTPEGGDAVAAWLETRRGQNDPLVEPAPDNPVAAWLKTRSGQGATVVEAAPHSPAAQGSTQGGAATDGAAYGHAAPETATSGGITDKTYPARSGEAPAAHGEPPRSVPPTGASDSETPANTAEGGGAHTKPQPEGRRGQ